MVADRRWITRVGPSSDRARHHPTDIGVDHGHPLAVGEAGHRTRGVGTNTRQPEQCVYVIGHHITMLLGDHDGAFMQSLRPPWIAELAPGPKYVGGTRRRGRRWRGPSRDPFHPDRRHPRHRGLLKHELTDHDLPRAHSGSAPRQLTFGPREPRDEILGGDTHGLTTSAAVHNTTHGEYQPCGSVDGTQGG